MAAIVEEVVSSDELAGGAAVSVSFIADQALVESTGMNRYSQKSARTYRGTFATFQTRLLAERPELACADDAGRLDLSLLRLGHVTSYLTALVHRRNPDGSPNSPSKSALTVIRCSIKFSYEMAGLEVPEWFAELGKFFKGLKRTAVSNRRIMSRRADLGDEGKAPMPFALYRRVALLMLTDSRESATWAHAYGVLTWNLMCRTNNTEALSTAALCWKGDALNVRLTKSKTDQTGETLRDGYHLYANPFMPEICPILALALHLLLFMIDPSGAIFSGRDQAARFSDSLSRVVSHVDSIGELTGYGVLAEEIGAHSYRKGSSTFATSGSLDGPSVVAVSCRAGWSLGSSLNRYLQKEAAGDQYVGRVVSGLPIHDASFAALPPHFRQDAAATTVVSAAVRRVFPDVLCAIEHLRPVLSICLASIVYHMPWLRAHVSTSSMLWTNVPFLSNHAAVAELRQFVIGPLEETSMMLPTGLPGHVRQLAQLRELASSVQNVSDRVQSVESHVDERIHSARQSMEAGLSEVVGMLRNLPMQVVEHLEVQQVDAGDASSETTRKVIVRDFSVHLEQAVERLQSAMTQSMAALDGRLAQVASASSALSTAALDDDLVPATTDNAAVHVNSAVEVQYGRYLWGGRFRKLPEDFQLPRICLYRAMQYWYLPTTLNGHTLPPLRSVSRRFDVPTSQQPRFTIWRKTFEYVEDMLRLRGMAPPTTGSGLEVEHAFAALRDDLRSACTGKRGERAEQMKIDTVEGYLRRRRNQMEAGGARTSDSRAGAQASSVAVPSTASVLAAAAPSSETSESVAAPSARASERISHLRLATALGGHGRSAIVRARSAR